MSAPTMPPLLRQRDVLAILRISRTQLWTWRNAGQFPAPLRLGPNSIAWPQSVIERWLKERASA